MSTFIDLMPQTLGLDEPEVVTADARPQEVTVDNATASDWERFADEQIRGLVRNLYLAGPKPCRQVVFSAVDRNMDVTALCRRVAEALSNEAGTTCLLEAGFPDQPESASFNSDQTRFGRLRDSSLQISSRLWYMPSRVFRGGPGPNSTAWLKARLAELRLEFDYLVIQAPAVTASPAAHLAQLSDGLVLIVEANSTRRVSAQKVRDTLAAAHVRLLGTVLCERTFPIPKAIYDRL